jgi:hypothetical protein
LELVGSFAVERVHRRGTDPNAWRVAAIDDSRLIVLGTVEGRVAARDRVIELFEADQRSSSPPSLNPVT